MKVTAWKLTCVVVLLAVAVGGFAAGLTVVAPNANAALCNCYNGAGCPGWHKYPWQPCDPNPECGYCL